jgi:hypothetical protein
LVDESNASETARITEEVAALAFRGQLQYPGPETGDWEICSESLPEVLYELRNREVLLIVATVDGGEPVHLCGICGSVLSKPGEPCPRCALINEDVAAALDGRRVAESVQEWLKGQGKPPTPHPLEAELERIQKVLDALGECPPLPNPGRKTTVFPRQKARHCG